MAVNFPDLVKPRSAVLLSVAHCHSPAIVAAIRSTIESKWTFLLALNVFLLIVGCMMDIFSAIVIVVPLISPLAIAYGVIKDTHGGPAGAGVTFQDITNLEK